ncbi:Trigger factor (TF) [Flavobacterium cauense R2A-7]|uniref:Trigger factor n=1 Tax=Flavobacterium cauense R2A-7 TaxID=1341154 RepID=V6S072_9FLAO|nr:trigger factor [Flavobacterium cauense]ESU20093.1 Trigger factor (TF) [Flavobacterium cauense R2A-7]KGO83895.1 peptidylprolyl isomerase [Flavobacterium cauense R2A-7]TWI14768.1 trigger factor [Flavobacterium cauense R2A-7]
MNITRSNVDALNAIVTVEVTKEDYAGQVEKILADYRKNASIPGFRKGAVPMSLIQKQYGKAVLLDEVNKLLQSSLNNYLVEEKLDILGNPLPKITEDFNWDADNYTFEFELGLAPEFKVDLTAKNKITKYTIVADDKMLDEQVERIQKQFGKLVSKDKVEEGDDLRGTFTNEENGINNTVNITLDIFKRKTDAKKFIGKKVGDVVTLGTKGLFDDDHKLMDYLKVDHDNVHGLDIEVNFTIEEINTSEKAELNQELFDKLFGEGNVTSVEEVKAKIKEDAEQQFASQADQKFLNDVTEFLIENTKFDLPAAFLKKWIQTVGETPLTPEQAEEEYAKSENGLRYQLIEGKVIVENNLQTTFEELKAFTSELIKKQMAQFGQMNPTDADVDGIVARVLSNQDEVKRLSEQIMSEKMVNLFKEKVSAKSKEVSYQDFIKEMYGE